MSCYRQNVNSFTFKKVLQMNHLKRPLNTLENRNSPVTKKKTLTTIKM